MSPEQREQHIRRMMAHGRKVQERLRQDTAEFEVACRKFWDFMRTARICEQNEREGRTQRELAELEQRLSADPNHKPF